MKARILVVDDDLSIRETFEQHLTECGHEVRSEADPREALRTLATFEAEVLFTDVRMEGLDGIELTRRALQGNPDLDIVVMTAFEDMRTAVDAMSAGARDYLIKPLDLDGLDAVVQKCLAARIGRASLVAREEGLGPGPDAEKGTRLMGRDPSMIEVFKTIGVLSQNRTTVLIRGETGTGKERVARAIHESSPAGDEPFVAVNCTALSPSLLESELFGHVRGAFTGAVQGHKGFFELAGRGTIFLDEIGDTSGDFQSKLLRVLDEGEFFPVGSEHPQRTEARVLAATHRPLEELVEQGAFREDLYFRLRVVELPIPPLRDRRGDIATLANHFLDRIRREQKVDVAGLTEEGLRRLEGHDWPGNVRELHNVLTRGAILARGGVIEPEHLELSGSVGGAPRPSADATLAEMEAAHVQAALKRNRGNKRQTALSLGITRPRLDRLIERHGLVLPD
jgi:DNA-binding NtrC family response regulator